MQHLTRWDNLGWMTPDETFKALDSVFHFVADMAADAQSAKCAAFITPELDALVEPWGDWAAPGEYVYINPPYGPPKRTTASHPGNPGVGAFVRRAYEEAMATGINVVMLLHAKTDTSWWHEYCWRADEIWEVSGRISFVHPETGRPGKGGPGMGQAVVIFRRDRQFPLVEGPQRFRVDRKMNQLIDHVDVAQRSQALRIR